MAGGRPTRSDPLFEFSAGRPKALITIAGKPMIAWILEAMLNARHIDSIAVVGLDMLPEFADAVDFLPDQGSLVDNLASGLSWARENKPEVESLLLSTSDIPTITGEIVDRFVELCLQADFAVYYPVVVRESMLSRFPKSDRTYVKLADLEAAGGDIIVVHRPAFDFDMETWRSVTNARKYPWRIAKIVGLSTLFKLITRRLTLEGATKKGEELIGHPVKVVLTGSAEIAMDVDTPEQMALLNEDLEVTGELP